MSAIVRSGVSRNQKRAIPALLAAATLREAAELVGVNERTLRRWLKQPHFKAALRQAENVLLDTVTRRMIAMSNEGLDEIQRIIRDPAEPTTQKRQAVSLVFTHMVRLREMRDFDTRLAEIELALFGGQDGSV